YSEPCACLTAAEATALPGQAVRVAVDLEHVRRIPAAVLSSSGAPPSRNAAADATDGAQRTVTRVRLGSADGGSSGGSGARRRPVVAYGPAQVGAGVARCDAAVP